MENIRSKMDIRSLKKIIVPIIIGVLIIGVITAAIIILTNAYNSRLHGNFAKADKVYGQNGFTGEIYELAEESQDEIKSQLSTLKKIEKTKANIYQTYIAVQMNEKLSYLIKYDTDTSVQIIELKTDENGESTYSDAVSYACEGSLPGLCKALETDHGMGYVLNK